MTKFFVPIHDSVFNKIHGSRLIYNTCWEDPRIDIELLKLNPSSQVVMITSAGCNALDYLLHEPERIHAVDVNPRQNALLELKLALVKLGGHDDLFQMFGHGHHDQYEKIFEQAKPLMSTDAANFWKLHINYFDKNRPRASFYYHGTTGTVAWYFLKFLYRIQKRSKASVKKLLNAPSLQAQKEIYAELELALWNRVSTWFIRQPGLMALLGVPRPQINLIERSYTGGLSEFVKDKLRHVFTEIPVSDNYFWRVYAMGGYTLSCCPNYLKKDNFAILKKNVNRLQLHTNTLAEFLEKNPGPYSHYVLLDHQDWLACHDPVSLSREWKLILENSRPGTKILMRSAGWDLRFIPKVIRSALTFFPGLTDPLHATDRVGTYGSLHLAEVT